jgi:hypothetical protein
VFVAFGAFVCFSLRRGIRFRIAYVLPGIFFGVLGANFIATTRIRGIGLDLTRIAGLSWVDVISSFGGEVGPLFSFSQIASHPIKHYFFFDPWLIAIERLIPSFLWSDKPDPTYLYIALRGFTADAKAAGVAIPQHVEMLLQFGWIGLGIVAFLYFTFAIRLLKRLARLGPEGRVVGAALVPVFFGFYMPTRGYFFQTLTDGLFTFGPLFAIHAFMPRRLMPVMMRHSSTEPINLQSPMSSPHERFLY